MIPGSQRLADENGTRQLLEACRGLEDRAPTVSGRDDWPADSVTLLGRTGLLAWGLPEEFGGRTATEVDMLSAYEALASACLTTTFILTQRNGACQRIAGSDNFELKSELLPPLSHGDAFATVGISHLTTSRQHLAKPAVMAVETDGGFLLTGSVPWVTGAAAAKHVVTGGALADGRQVLLAVPTSLPGVEIGEPMHLLALCASRTSAVVLNDVEVPRRYLLAGPVEQVMKQGAGGGAGSLTTSALAVGVTQGILRRFANESARRPDLLRIHKALEAECSETSSDLYAAVRGETGSSSPNAESVRQKANSLVLRAAQAFLAASKGAGFVTGHPAERAVREAMFFLVWSCPQPVVAAALREFACVVD